MKYYQIRNNLSLPIVALTIFLSFIATSSIAGETDKPTPPTDATLAEDKDANESGTEKTTQKDEVETEEEVIVLEDEEDEEPECD